MKRKRKLLGVILIVTALLVMQLPPSGVDAASIPEFYITGSGTLISYNGTSANVVIPSSVIEIATDAFKDNDNIRSITIPDSVRKINEYAFWDCDNLQYVTIGKGLTKIDDFVFANCMGLISVNIPSNIRSVGIYAFEDDVNLEAVTFTQYTHDIHESAFDGCYKLVIFAPEGSYAWEYAQGFYNRQKKFPVYEDLGSIDVIDITPEEEHSEPGETEVIDETGGLDLSGAFTTEYEVTQRPDGTYTAVATHVNTDIYGESHVVGNAAVIFMDNSSLHVYDGSEPDTNETEEGITGNISSDTVRYTSSIPKYTIVDDLIVADKAYYQASDLDMSLPNSIREIGQFAFSRTDVESIRLPEGVEKIDYGAFYHCDRLTDVKLPQTVMKIEPYAFAETAWLQDFLSNPGGINNKLNADLNASSGDFLVSGGALITYRGTGSNVTVPEGVRIIAAGCFKDNKNIESVAFPSTLLSIGEEAFSGCSSLDDVSFGGNETEILDRAFAGTGVSVSDKPDRIVNVGIGAFDDLESGSGDLNITYEETTQRLSNASLRPSEADKDNAGVSVIGLARAQAYLDGADRPYTLQISVIPVSDVMHAAMDRASGFLEGLEIGEMVCYNLILTDDSGIPITKLGNQGLEVAIPIPDKLKDANLMILTCDRNGQLEDIPVTIVDSPSGKYARFITYHLSSFVLCETEGNIQDQIIASDVVLKAATGGHVTGSYQGNAIKNWFASRGVVRIVISGLLVLTGILLLALKKKRA